MTNDAKDIFFKGAVSFYNNLQSHFFGISQGEHAIIFDLNKDILEVLIGEMMFNNFVEEDHEYDNEFIESDEAQCRTILDKRHDTSVTAKKRAIILFKIQADESNDEVNIYTVTNSLGKFFDEHIGVSMSWCPPD